MQNEQWTFTPERFLGEPCAGSVGKLRVSSEQFSKQFEPKTPLWPWHELLVCCFTSNLRIFHSHTDVTMFQWRALKISLYSTHGVIARQGFFVMSQIIQPMDAAWILN